MTLTYQLPPETKDLDGGINKWGSIITQQQQKKNKKQPAARISEIPFEIYRRINTINNDIIPLAVIYTIFLRICILVSGSDGAIHNICSSICHSHI